MYGHDTTVYVSPEDVAKYGGETLHEEVVSVPTTTNVIEFGILSDEMLDYAEEIDFPVGLVSEYSQHFMHVQPPLDTRFFIIIRYIFNLFLIFVGDCNMFFHFTVVLL